MSNPRFIPEIFEHTKLKIKDVETGKYVGFSFTSPPCYEGEHDVQCVWHNDIAAHNFADRLYKLNR